MSVTGRRVVRKLSKLVLAPGKITTTGSRVHLASIRERTGSFVGFLGLVLIAESFN